MKLLHGLLSLISASQMMLVWNCPNSDGPSGAFLESIPDCPGALQLNVPISMGDLEKLSTVQKSGKTPSLFFLKSSHEEIAQVAIEEADSLIAERNQKWTSCYSPWHELPDKQQNRSSFYRRIFRISRQKSSSSRWSF
ncbi:unnamed protein product [Oikopleura dioica]|uniref:Uncharacterized protein n=1 Tax=Oikopleura dioica TaxID=34765 RepID=E4YTH2_OIKDI|nr:unnamed protein product [Oikopleura dioica]